MTYLISSVVPFVPKTAEDVRLLVASAFDTMSDSEMAAQIAPLIRPAVRQTLHWEYGNNEPYTAWRFAELGERDIWAAYCAFGHGALGNPWGLVFIDSDQFGPDFSWYPGLDELFAEWFA